LRFARGAARRHCAGAADFDQRAPEVRTLRELNRLFQIRNRHRIGDVRQYGGGKQLSLLPRRCMSAPSHSLDRTSRGVAATDSLAVRFRATTHLAQFAFVAAFGWLVVAGVVFAGAIVSSSVIGLNNSRPPFSGLGVWVLWPRLGFLGFCGSSSGLMLGCSDLVRL
jgi:hypothetical protein